MEGSRKTAFDLWASAQVCERLVIERHQLARLVATGRLEIAHKLPGRRGAWLFRPADVERLAAELTAEAEARAAELRAAAPA